MSGEKVGQPVLLQCPCEGRFLKPVHVFHSPPPLETKFDLSGQGPYKRELKCCGACGHFVSLHNLDLRAVYEGKYVDATYRDAQGVRRTYEKIINLPPEKSDNKGRAARIVKFATSYFTTQPAPGGRTVLDVGSGLCVFLHEMKKAGWNGTALDPDPRAAAHARDVVGVNAVCADFRTAGDLGTFDVITFNKVLEHVDDPVGMLEQSRPLVAPGGFVYVELPDGEAAIAEGPEREEFTIDHPHVFSPASIAMLARNAGFSVKLIERMQEPSTKYTLWAFLEVKK